MSQLCPVPIQWHLKAQILKVNNSPGDPNTPKYFDFVPNENAHDIKSRINCYINSVLLAKCPCSGFTVGEIND